MLNDLQSLGNVSDEFGFVLLMSSQVSDQDAFVLPEHGRFESVVSNLVPHHVFTFSLLDPQSLRTFPLISKKHVFRYCDSEILGGVIFPEGTPPPSCRRLEGEIVGAVSAVETGLVKNKPTPQTYFLLAEFTRLERSGYRETSQIAVETNVFYLLPIEERGEVNLIVTKGTITPC